MKNLSVIFFLFLGLTLISCGSDSDGEGADNNNNGIVNPINNGNYQYQYCGNIVANSGFNGPTALLQLNNSQIMYLYPENYSVEIQNILRSFYQPRYACVYSNSAPSQTLNGVYFYVQAIGQ